MRTVHSSYVNLDPADYQFAGVFDARPEPGTFVGPGGTWWVSNEATDEDLEHEGTNPENAQYRYLRGLLEASPNSLYEHDEEGGRCDHCGANLRYVVVMRHTPSGEYLAVGETCFRERFSHQDRVAKDLDRLRKRASAQRVHARVRADFEKWLAADPRNLEAFEYAEANHEGNGFFTDLLEKIKKYGTWSERQRDAVLRGKTRDADRQQREAEWAKEPRVPCPEGRITIIGEVVSVKTQENDFGVRHVMTVKDDRGFLVWGTLPRALEGRYDYESDTADVVRLVGAAERGARVEFTATVTRSDRDATFGFYKRPASATLLAEAPKAEVNG